MFRGLINDAKSAVSSVVLKYIARASVAVPFIIAIGFALAAATAMLVDRFGSLAAYWLMAGGLAIIGLVAALVVSVREQEEETADVQAQKVDTANVAGEVAAQAPLAALGALFTVPGGAGAALAATKLLGKNYALVVFALLIGMLFWPTKSSAGQTEEADADLFHRSESDGIEKVRASAGEAATRTTL